MRRVGKTAHVVRSCVVTMTFFYGLAGISLMWGAAVARNANPVRTVFCVVLILVFLLYGVAHGVTVE